MRTRFVVYCAVALVVGIASAQTTHQSTRQKAQKLQANGNFKEAFPLFRQLALDPKNDPKFYASDLQQATQCLQRLNRARELDTLREAVANAHPKVWQALQAVAQSYISDPYRYGHMISGEYQRGPRRGNSGKVVNSFARDRIRALQLMKQALPLIEASGSVDERGTFYRNFADMLLANRGHRDAWRLQYKSDLSQLPDYDEGHYYAHRQVQAPVDAEGNPVFHKVGRGFEESATDGERWRYLLTLAAESSPSLRQQMMRRYADFLHQQFGVQSLRQYSYFGRIQAADNQEESILQLDQLGEDESIAKLASGIKRFKLPPEHNFIRLYRELAESTRDTSVIQILAQIYENRRQYPKAAEMWRWRQSIRAEDWAAKRLDQIVGNWGQFETGEMQLAGRGATVDYRFRNGKKVSFTAHHVDVEKLLKDTREHIESNPRRLDHQKMNLGNIGHRLVMLNQAQYIGKKAAEWSLTLTPRGQHFDKRITVTTPLQEPGLYLLQAKLRDGNISRTLVWLTDTIISQKQVDKQTWYFVADAATGKPIAGATLDFFGYRQQYIGNKLRQATGRRHDVFTKTFQRSTNDAGQLFVNRSDVLDEKKQHYQWLVTARHGKRMAFIGFQGIWQSNYANQQYQQRKAFVITDRPVYRPKQTVKFKLWATQAQYDHDGESPYAGSNITINVHNPKGEKIFSKNYKADGYGGVDGEFELADDATLGQYYINSSVGGYQHFRVEEYKKPEFEVTVDAPSEPAKLGDAIDVTVNAQYLFGAPVTEAKVKIKVLRTTHDATWYPPAPWDWLYGPGYWWFAYDYSWYPGWHRWGCGAPIAWWWPRSRQAPEVVMELERPIGKDGKVAFTIDTDMAKRLHGNSDHQYQITAEVRDRSRRTIVGNGKVIVAREPFKVYTWVDRGYYHVGDPIVARMNARSVDNKPVAGKGVLKLLKIHYDADGKASEDKVQEWPVNTNSEGAAQHKLSASEPGQYRLSYTVTDSKGHSQEGGYLFSVRGQGFDGADFRFNAIELIPDKTDYRPGETVKLMINTNHRNSYLLLFVRPVNGVYLRPKQIQMSGKSTVVDIPVTKADMPNFFVEAVTISDGKIHTLTKEIIVPPEKRVLNVEVLPSKKRYTPGEQASVKLKLTDFFGEPVVGSMAVSIYDKAVEYISGGANIPEIRTFFWKWRRRHNPQVISNLRQYFGLLLKRKETGMSNIGIFGHTVADMQRGNATVTLGGGGGQRMRAKGMAMAQAEVMVSADMAVMEGVAAPQAAKPMASSIALNVNGAVGGAAAAPAFVEATVRTQFADTAYWSGEITTDQRGEAEVELTMPENLTGWSVRTWAMGKGTRVGEGRVEVVTAKNVLVRLQAPRFFVQKDEVVLSANVHNYLDEAKEVKVVLDINDVLKVMDTPLSTTVTIPANGEKRVDWRVKVVAEGEARVQMKALTNVESDAMEMRFPAKIHGITKTVSFSGHLPQSETQAALEFTVPAERRPGDSVLEVRYSPSLAGAMVDALPYLVSYPYGCTEQTLNRFLPTVIVQKILLDTGVSLEDVRKKRSNLNAQEIGDDKTRSEQWKRGRRHVEGYDKDGNPIWAENAVFDTAAVRDMIKVGVQQLSIMQLDDGGWGWFSGYGERSTAHTTAYVVHGLQIARENDVQIPDGMIKRGVKWLENYQDEQVRLLKNHGSALRKRSKRYAGHLDAFVFMVLTDAGVRNKAMLNFLYRDRTELAVYAKCMLGMALHKLKDGEKLTMILRNVEQFLVKDEENQTAYLNLGNGGYWWNWYGSEWEAHAYYLKLLARVAPKGETAPWLVKYLINNRRHATHWNSTRDTAICLEAMADYMRASGEDQPDMTLSVYLDGKKQKDVVINANNFLSFDNKLLLTDESLKSGKHRLELRRTGKGPIYFNAYLQYFSLEDMIKKAGLEIKVERAYYKLTPVDKTIKVAGARGQALDQKVEKYKRTRLDNLSTLKSGELVEIELTVESKNDYEYIVFEDLKAAGFEPVALQSGYSRNGMGAYMELRDDRVAFFVRNLARGKHSLSYRLRAEIPGLFSALPTQAYAMYAPELKGNADEIKLRIEDAPDEQ